MPHASGIGIAACALLLAALCLLPGVALAAAEAAGGAYTQRAGTLTQSELLARRDGGVEGMALMRPVLQGVLYRAGFKGGDKAHSGLSGAQREALCAAGFSGAFYVDFGSRTQFGETRCAQGSFDYVRGATANPAPIMRRIHEVVADPQRGPLLLHCMWGVHSSGAIAAMALVQFCGWPEADAKAYWNAARNDAPCAGGCPAWIDARFERFTPDPGLVPDAHQRASICPPRPPVAGAVQAWRRF